MNIKKHIQNNLIELKVIPNSSKDELVENPLKLYIKAVPDKNKANISIIKFFKKEFNLNIEIKSGLKSRKKVLKVIEA